MSRGWDDAGVWHKNEDFRWPRALSGFLDAVSKEYGGSVDLVIAGDFLELWQRPTPCAGPRAREAMPVPAELGGACSVAEMRDLAESVVAGHEDVFRALARFARSDGNCLIVTPGNHDASLVLDEVWTPVARALMSEGGCIRRPNDGVWFSPQLGLVVEHGHQIGQDANKYAKWPKVTQQFGNGDYLVQPWGEAFVQRIFNAEESEYPLIDNLSPSSAGVRYRMAERGLSGTASDVARFLTFNLFDTSLRQKAQILGEKKQGRPRWSVSRARALGYRLFLSALPPGDPFAAALGSDSPEWAKVRAELDAQARTLPEEEILALCDQLAIRKSGDACQPPTLGAMVEALIFSRERVIAMHLVERKKTHTNMRALVYGHTHSFEMPWDVRIKTPASVIRVANSGAFQRLVDDDRIRDLANAAGLSPGQFLQQRSPEDLPACYTSVHVRRINGERKVETRAWLMKEDDASGIFIDPCGNQCPNLGHGCGK
jgi:UDP-2,3-diacylglucosamine pyrophosphatase LpxH